jgi:predicted transglutaminase-like cysteine proteinase
MPGQGRQMWIFGSLQAFRVMILGCGLALLGSASLSAATSLNSSGSIALTERDRPSDEPFGLFASPLFEGELRDKWLGVERALDDEMLVLALCREDRAGCWSLPALQFLAIVDNATAREARARLGEVNRAVNLAIKPVSDLVQYGSIDVWSSPLATFATGAGDCEDYAIAKFVALRLSGIATEDLRLVILRDTIRQEDHAMVAARLQGRWLLLDNRRMAMVEDAQLRNYQPTFVIDHAGVRQYSAAPLLSVARSSDLDSAPAPAAPSQTETASSGKRGSDMPPS